MDQLAGLRLTTSQLDAYRIAALRGEIDIATAPALDAFLARCVRETAQPGRLVVDMSGVTFIDAQGLTALLRALTLSRERSVPLILAALPHRVALLMRLAGLDRVFDVVAGMPLPEMQPPLAWHRADAGPEPIAAGESFRSA